MKTIVACAVALFAAWAAVLAEVVPLQLSAAAKSVVWMVSFSSFGALVLCLFDACLSVWVGGAGGSAVYL